MSSASPLTPPSKALSNATNIQVYPSPSLSPVASFHSVMESMSAENRRKSSVRSLMASTNPPASPLDALVMALEATAKEIKDPASAQEESILSVPSSQEQEDEEDPNATVPSSPTLFMKRAQTSDPSIVPSLHQLPGLLLPEAVVLPREVPSISSSLGSSVQYPISTNLTPSSHPEKNSKRKMSVSSQDSAGSAVSIDTNGEIRKTFACSVGNCEKKFSQVAHLRIHERCHTGTRPFIEILGMEMERRTRKDMGPNFFDAKEFWKSIIPRLKGETWLLNARTVEVIEC
ncbi:hypothetical protein BGZ76_008818 [Entomortierella beljakovae]|nr:hypothetical protein BGZ76_008818 [Entomortierella beljakovae]